MLWLVVDLVNVAHGFVVVAEVDPEVVVVDGVAYGLQSRSSIELSHPRDCMHMQYNTIQYNQQ